jgi:hypothetical protein
MLARKFDNDDAAWSLPFEHFMCAGFGEITSAVPFDEWHCLLEVVGESSIVVDLVLADVKGRHLWLSGFPIHRKQSGRAADCGDWFENDPKRTLSNRRRSQRGPSFLGPLSLSQAN